MPRIDYYNIILSELSQINKIIRFFACLIYFLFLPFRGIVGANA